MPRHAPIRLPSVFSFIPYSLPNTPLHSPFIASPHNFAFIGRIPLDRDQINQIYHQLLSASASSSCREALELRKIAIANLTNPGIIKVAFDTRRIDQGHQIIPRRGLQNYHRSDSFISEAIEQKLSQFGRLQKVLQSIKKTYENEPEWQDSYARNLLSSLDNGLRSLQKDADYTDNQPGVGSFDYLEELLHVRYRLTPEGLLQMSDQQIKQAILSKDEDLLHKDSIKETIITRHDIAVNGYDSLIDKLFSVKATADQPDVERTITITIRDRLPSQKKEG